MSLRLWLVLFIISMAVSAEVLAWAVQHGQFHNVNRARWAPLRPRGLEAALNPPAKRRPWVLWVVMAGFAALLVVWLDGMVPLALMSLGR